MYMDMISEDDEEYMRELKQQNRDLAIDILLDEKDESEWDNRHILKSDVKEESNSQWGSNSVNTYSSGVIAPKVIVIGVVPLLIKIV